MSDTPENTAEPKIPTEKAPHTEAKPSGGEYRVKLDAYSGPLDLLMYLVRRNEIDLNDIPIAELTEQYLQHVKLMQMLDVDRAGEFLVMAATLLEIKSQMLVPKIDEAVRDKSAEKAEEETETQRLDESDPRYELVQQLLAYKRFKDIAIELEYRETEYANRFQATPKRALEDPDAQQEEVEIDLADINILDLCRAFTSILDSIGRKPIHEVTFDDTPISLHADDIYDRLASDGPMTLQQIFVGRTNRSELIGLFLATLELVKNHRVTLIQDRILGEISLKPIPHDQQDDKPDDKDAAERWRDADTGEMSYMWPDAVGFQHYIRREKIRRTHDAKQKAEQTGERFNAAAWKRAQREWEAAEYKKHGFEPPVYKESSRPNPFAKKAAGPNQPAPDIIDEDLDDDLLEDSDDEVILDLNEDPLDAIERKLQEHRAKQQRMKEEDENKLNKLQDTLGDDAVID